MRAAIGVVVVSILPFLSPTSASTQDKVEARADACQTGYFTCAPEGSTTTSVPKIGDATFRQLYINLINTDLPNGASTRRTRSKGVQERGAGASLCCQESTLCYNLNALSIPFCYDKFTTNYFLPDGSYGNIHFGSYTSSTGDEVNLISGDFISNGTGSTGNIYTADESEKPNTATITAPSQFTASGIGSAIPATALGAVATVVYTNVIQATTIQAVTLSASLSLSSASAIVVTTTIPATTMQATTKVASTIVTTATIPAESASAIVSSANAAVTSTKNLARSHEGHGVMSWLVGGIIVVANFVF